MRCGCINDLLALVIVLASLLATTALAESDVDEKTYSQDFMMISAKKCLDKASVNADFFCKGNFTPKNLNRHQLQVVDENKALVRFSSSAGSESDELELLCYRCSFKKIDKKYCGRFQSVWDKPQFAPKCPGLE